MEKHLCFLARLCFVLRRYQRTFIVTTDVLLDQLLFFSIVNLSLTLHHALHG